MDRSTDTQNKIDRRLYPCLMRLDTQNKIDRRLVRWTDRNNLTGNFAPVLIMDRRTD